MPFHFVYDNSLLLLNTTLPGAVYITLTATARCNHVPGNGAIGYFKTAMIRTERVLFLAAAILLIIPGWATDLAGFVLGLLGIASQMIRARNLLRGNGAAHG